VERDIGVAARERDKLWLEVEEEPLQIAKTTGSL
jgi:hypothetical protein